MRIVARFLVSVCVCCCAENLYAQHFDAREMIFNLKEDRLLQRELEMTEEQKKDLFNILKSPKTIAVMREKYDLSREQGKVQGLTIQQMDRQYFDECNKYYWVKIEDILIKKQVVRLKQLQRRFNPLVSYEFQTLLAHSEELGLTKQQEAQIRGMTERLLIAHEQETKDLGDDIYDKLVSQLPAPIRERYLDLVGERFDFDKMEKEKTENVAKRIWTTIEAHKVEKGAEGSSDSKSPLDDQ